MTTDELLTRAREAAEGYCGTNTIEIETFIDGALWHASQQPTREQIARAIYDALGGDYAPYRAATDAVLALYENGAGS